LDWLLVRGSWGQGFRAPSLPELFLGRSISFDNYIDQIRCPVTDSNLDCALDEQLDTIGNALLEPETSESFTLGVVVEVPMVENLTVGVDYWNFKHDEVISDVDVDEILEREADCFNGLPGCDPAFASLVSRTPATPGDILLGIPGTISTVTSAFLNLSEQQTDGFDFEVRYLYDTSRWGAFRLTSYVTYVTSFDFALLPSDPLEKFVGQHLYPKLRATTDLSWNYNDYQVGLYNRYIGSHDQDETLADFNGQPGAQIPSHSEWDLRFVYTGFPLFTLSVGVENFTNEDIPLDWDATEGYNVGYYNNRGRFFYSQVGVRF
jgi:iron complex outermembrane receptor protein